jgi:hypothetical protein
MILEVTHDMMKLSTLPYGEVIMSKDYGEVSQAVVVKFKRLIDTHPDVELKGGKKLPNTSVNGNMFSFVSKGGKIALRLGKAEREAFITKYNSKLAENYGVVMKEYVEVPDDLAGKTEELAPYLAMSYAYAQTLKPK